MYEEAKLVKEEAGFVVRRMTRADLKHAFRWSVEEGWNIGLYDHDVFFATDPNGFFIGELDGVPVGSVSGVAYNDTFGFVGIYIVAPPFRGKSYGIQLFRAALDYLGNRTIGLDGVVAQQENYRRSGFRTLYRNRRYEGVGGGAASADCVPLSAVPFDALNAYDRRHFLAPRPQFLRGWISQPESVALGVVKNGEIAGYGVIRRMVHGWLIAPLFADSVDLAEALFQSLAAQKPNEPVLLDVPKINPQAVALAERHAMKPIFETARMIVGPELALPHAEIFGVTSYELG